MSSGIYKIINLKTNKVYIGSSSNLRQRWSSHRSALRYNRHANKHLQLSWNKFGEAVFKFVIIKLCSIVNLLKFEQYYINKEKPYIRSIGYNCTKYAKAWRGLRHSKITRAIISKKLIGNKHAVGMIPWNKGKKLPKWIRKKLSEAKLKCPTTYWLCKKRSKSTNLKISKTLYGRKLSKQHSKNIGLGHLGLTHRKG